MIKKVTLLIMIGCVSIAVANGQEATVPKAGGPIVGMESAPTRTDKAPVFSTKDQGMTTISSTPASTALSSEVTPTISVPSRQGDAVRVSSADNFVTLNFTNVDISALIKVMSELARKNFILDERVAGKVTLMTPTRISPEEAYQVFLSALEIKGFTAVEDGKITRIIPTATARQSGLKVFQDDSVKGEGYITKLIRMNFVNPQEIVRTLSPLMTKDGSVIAYAATNSLIVTDSVSNIRKIETLVRAMDVAAPAGKGKINVFYLKYANAEDIAKMMQALVSRLPAATTATGAAQPAGPTTILEGTVTITADKATNSLIIVGSPGDYETMKDVIQKLDIRRRQVYVEAAIIEMSLSKSLDIGFEFQSYNRVSSDSTTALGGTNFGNIGNVISGGPAGLAALNGLVVAAVKGVFTYNGIEYLNVGALIHALQSNGDVNILSTPNLLTTDNQKAEILVGSNIPFVTGQTQNAATGGTAILTTIDRKDVGVSLKITPQITSDDSVRLDVYEEISDIITTPGLNVNVVGPSTSKRSASTTVVVKDRQTMVIGGLVSDNVNISTSQVPFLGDIPILGWLFKTRTTSVNKTNLMIFITPYIVKNEADAGEMTNKKSESQEKFRQEYHIDKKDLKSDLPKTPTTPPKPSSTNGSVGNNQSANTLKQNEVKDVPLTAPVNPSGNGGSYTLKSAPTDTLERKGSGGALVPASSTNASDQKDTMHSLKTSATRTEPDVPKENLR